MTFPDINTKREKIFAGKTIYYSGSIRGVPNSDPEFPWTLVQYIQGNGANVLDEHVGARNRSEMAEIFHRRSGIDIAAIEDKTERARVARKQDLEWLHKATHFIALVDSPSFGVGIEIQETIRKPKLGFNKTPMLFLVSKKVMETDSLSNMITGIDPESEEVDCTLGVYENEDDAKRIITEFLTSH